MGDWLTVNGPAVYATTPQYPYATNVSAAGGVVECRVTRNDENVFVTAFTGSFGNGAWLPATLRLPFVVDVPGGVDGTWPRATLAAATLLGVGTVPFSFDPVRGLSIEVPVDRAPPTESAVVFELSFSGS